MSAFPDEPSAQLHLSLRRSVADAVAQRKPLLHHLNADTSWLLQLPRPTPKASSSTSPPAQKQTPSPSSRAWFNILIDPWLSGPQSDVASWFSQQTHAVAPAVGSIAEVELLLREIELLSHSPLPSQTPSALDASNASANGVEQGTSVRQEAKTVFAEDSFIDAVVISHEFTDHCHKETLLGVHPSVPVVATKHAARLVQGWKHFAHVVETPVFGAHNTSAGKGSPDLDWRRYRLCDRDGDNVPAVLPPWLAVTRIVTPGDALDYHSAVFIVFDSDGGYDTANGHRYADALADANGEGQGSAQSIIYTPHGTLSATLTSVIERATPRPAVLALLHGLHDVRISAQQLNLGGPNGLAAQKALGARFWVGTHDEVKQAGGLVKWFLRRKVYAIRDLIGGSAEESDIDGKGELGKTSRDEENGADDEFNDGTHYLELANGESVVLDAED